MDKVTIVIPTYNDENYIRDAINSVLVQRNHDWQLIIVNDKSTDKTSEIINGYANCFPNKIKVIENPENKGVGWSRFYGICQTHTKYITFLDSDDIITPDYIEKSLELAEQHDSDVVYTSFTIWWPEQNKRAVIDSGNFLLQGEATPQMHFKEQMKFLTGKLFKTELLKKIPWSKKRIGEDVQTLFFATYEADKVRTSSYSGYIHRYRTNSLLADAPFFFCYCHSTMAEIEMLEYLENKHDEKIYKYVIVNGWNNFQKALRIENDSKLGIDATGKHKNQDSKEEWEYIKKWYNERLHIINTFILEENLSK